MNLDKDPAALEAEKRREQLRQLEHDMKTYLGVITTGLHALKLVRENPDDFAEMHQTIEKEGVDPLKAIVAQIINLTLKESE